MNVSFCYLLEGIFLNAWLGQRSFQHFRKVNGIAFPVHVKLWLNDACNTSHPNLIRLLFAIIFTPTLLHIQQNHARNINCTLLKTFSVWKFFNFCWNSNMNMHFAAEIYIETLIMAWDSCLDIENKILSQLGMISSNQSAVTSFDVELRCEQNCNKGFFFFFCRI